MILVSNLDWIYPYPEAKEWLFGGPEPIPAHILLITPSLEQVNSFDYLVYNISFKQTVA